MKGGNAYAIMDGVFRLAVFGIFYTVIAFLNLLIIACATAAVVCLVNLMFFCNGGNVSACALAVEIAYAKIGDLMNSHDGIDRLIEKWRGASKWKKCCSREYLLSRSPCRKSLSRMYEDNS